MAASQQSEPEETHFCEWTSKFASMSEDHRRELSQKRASDARNRRMMMNCPYNRGTGRCEVDNGAQCQAQCGDPGVVTDHEAKQLVRHDGKNHLPRG